MNNNDLVCPICGEPTNVYMGNARKDKLCFKHGKMLNKGEIFIDSHGRFREKGTNTIIELYKKESVCPICENPTYTHKGKPRKDLLCKKHASELNDGKIKILNNIFDWDNINLWDIDIFVDTESYSILNKTKLPYELYKQVMEEIEKLKHSNSNNTNKTEEKKQSNLDFLEPSLDDSIEYDEVPEIIKVENKIKCITCGYESEGRLFCKKCYQRFKDKTILIKIRNCIEIESLDTSYEGHYVCDDGHVVKSQAEREIDDYLFSKDIKHGYELELNLKDEKGKDVILHPDFCIFGDTEEENIYIEYWGVYGNRKYTETKKFKMPIYEKSGITLINLYGKTDLKNIKSALKRKLDPKNYEKGKVNFKE